MLVVIPFADEAEAVRIANDTPYGLAGAVWTRDVFRGIRVLKQIRAGILWLNTYHPTYNEAPWGGYKQSGFGRELGPYGLEHYLETKQININLVGGADRVVLSRVHLPLRKADGRVTNTKRIRTRIRTRLDYDPIRMSSHDRSPTRSRSEKHGAARAAQAACSRREHAASDLRRARVGRDGHRRRRQHVHRLHRRHRRHERRSRASRRSSRRSPSRRRASRTSASR